MSDVTLKVSVDTGDVEEKLRGLGRRVMLRLIWARACSLFLAGLGWAIVVGILAFMGAAIAVFMVYLGAYGGIR